MTAPAMTLSERADACLAALDDTGQRIARRVILRLVRFGDAAGTSRQQPVSALRAGDGPARLAATLRQLTEARLLTIDGDAAADDARVGLADDNLIAAWPALQAWIRSDGTTEQLRRQLEADAAAWSQRTDRDAGLLDKPQLSELSTWLTAETRRAIGFTDAAESFIAASRTAARWRPGKSYVGTLSAIALMLLLLATPIILLFIVVLTAWVIHKQG